MNSTDCSTVTLISWSRHKHLKKCHQEEKERKRTDWISSLPCMFCFSSVTWELKVTICHSSFKEKKWPLKKCSLSCISQYERFCNPYFNKKHNSKPVFWLRFLCCHQSTMPAKHMMGSPRLDTIAGVSSVYLLHIWSCKWHWEFKIKHVVLDSSMLPKKVCQR